MVASFVPRNEDFSSNFVNIIRWWRLLAVAFKVFNDLLSMRRECGPPGRDTPSGWLSKDVLYEQLD